MIIADTSVWIDHLRKGNSKLEMLLEEGLVLTHEFIIGELACGLIKNREEFFVLLDQLPSMQTLTQNEVLFFLNKNKLFGKGIGWIDLHLIASAYLNRDKIYTLDKKLFYVANDLMISF